MKTLGKLLTTAAFIFSGTVLANVVEKPTQHFVFTYDHQNQVDPLHYMVQQMEQEIKFGTVVAIQQQANHNLYQLGQMHQGMSYAAVQKAEPAVQQLSE